MSQTVRHGPHVRHVRGCVTQRGGDRERDAAEMDGAREAERSLIVSTSLGQPPSHQLSMSDCLCAGVCMPACWSWRDNPTVTSTPCPPRYAATSESLWLSFCGARARALAASALRARADLSLLSVRWGYGTSAWSSVDAGLDAQAPLSWGLGVGVQRGTDGGAQRAETDRTAWAPMLWTGGGVGVPMSGRLG